ncbi:MAG: type I methionyl aminopeptidase [Candidatus Dojkabacteria bacterium]|nr:type I methionyl aminopeptidase [Candidatus Dojkabacteria bacterium]
MPKTDSEISYIRESSKILSLIFTELERIASAGISTLEIDKYANFLCRKYKVKPAFKGYKGYRHTICANVNDIIVHGVPNNRKLKNGDIIGLDMGVIYQGYYSDMSKTIYIGDVTEEVKRFVEKTYQSMMNGITILKPGIRVGDISYAMRDGLYDDKFILMEDFVGHGIGKSLHERPNIPGHGLNKGMGDEIKENMVLAIESISVMADTNEYFIESDQWTVRTKSGALSALFEHTVLVTKDGYEILTLS